MHCSPKVLRLRSWWCCHSLKLLPASSFVFPLLLRVSFWLLFVTITSQNPSGFKSYFFLFEIFPNSSKENIWRKVGTTLPACDVFTSFLDDLWRICPVHRHALFKWSALAPKLLMLPLSPLVFSFFLRLWYLTQSPSPLHTLLKHLSYLYFKVPLKKSFGERTGEFWLLGMILPATGIKYEEVVRFTWWTTQLERSGCEQAEAANLTTCLLSLFSHHLPLFSTQSSCHLHVSTPF